MEEDKKTEKKFKEKRYSNGGQYSAKKCHEVAL